MFIDAAFSNVSISGRQHFGAIMHGSHTLVLPRFGRFPYGSCQVPLLVDPNDNYEMQGRIELNEGPLSKALYQFIGDEATQIMEKFARKLEKKKFFKKRKNLEKSNNKIADWIETKLTDIQAGIAMLAEKR